MEDAEKIDISNRPSEKDAHEGIGGAGCPFWFFGDEKSADKDMKEKFEVVGEDDEKKD